jgi:hypothetical protein
MRDFLELKEQNHLTCFRKDQGIEYVLIGLFHLEPILVVGMKQDQGISGFEGLASLKVSHHVFCLSESEDK